MPARNKIVLSGVIAGGLERFAVSCDYILDGGGVVSGAADLQQWANLAAAALNDGVVDYPNITAIMGANVNVTQVKVYEYGSSGPAIAVGEAPCLWLGANTIRVPFSSAVCVTKRTALAGRSYRGRLYWPALAATMNSNGSFNATQALTDDFAELLTQLGNTDGVEFAKPAVTSQAQGDVTVVTALRVGNVLDSQQGRRDNLVETYLTAPLP